MHYILDAMTNMNIYVLNVDMHYNPGCILFKIYMDYINFHVHIHSQSCANHDSHHGF